MPTMVVFKQKYTLQALISFEVSSYLPIIFVFAKEETSKYQFASKQAL